MKIDLPLKRRIDDLLGTPVLWLIGFSARLLGSLLNRNHARLPVQRILVMKFQGIGSLAIALPALKALRLRFPEAKIVFWGTPSTVGLAKRSGIFDQHCTLDDSDLKTSIVSLFKSLGTLMLLRFDWAFDLEVYSKLSSILLTLTCARNRAGFAIESVSHREHTHTHLILFNRYLYVGEAIARLFSLCCESPLDVKYSEAFKFTRAEVARPDSGLHPEVFNSPIIVLNPNVGELAKVRAWPEENFFGLLMLLAKRLPDYRFVLVGKGDEEIATSARICEAFNTSAGAQGQDRVLNLADRLSLDGLIQLLAKSNLVITADTSILHLAALTHAPTVALFGPTLEKTYMNVAEGWRTKALSTTLYCRPCVHHWPTPPCGGDNICMKSIEIEDVYAATLELLNLPPEPNEAPVAKIAIDSHFVPGLVFRRQE